MVEAQKMGQSGPGEGRRVFPPLVIINYLRKDSLANDGCESIFPDIDLKAALIKYGRLCREKTVILAKSSVRLVSYWHNKCTYLFTVSR